MATKALARGMGTFFKDRVHPESRWSKCPHEYKIRYRDAAGKQTEESGYTTQDQAIDRLTEVYAEKRAAPSNHARAERIKKYGAMRFEEYTTSGRPANAIWPQVPSGTSTRCWSITSSPPSAAAG
ncbi:hypothetical protein ACFO3J_12680 [Streptomyces polygonati]|uniref:Integrase SAM-like N-terminal domain-containing protein n=1 Tax=Streptomyces polygonati TaxID=1617087 RepID=A0ABV8HNG6_9ACTN